MNTFKSDIQLCVFIFQWTQTVLSEYRETKLGTQEREMSPIGIVKRW